MVFILIWRGHFTGNLVKKGWSHKGLINGNQLKGES